MIRRSQQRRHKERRAQRDFERAYQDSQVHGTYTPPPRDECSSRSFVTPVDDLDTIRIDHFLWRFSGSLVDFVLVLKVASFDTWQEVARIDCYHGHVHMHKRGREDESEHIRRLEHVDDVPVAYEEADTIIETFAVQYRDRRGRD